MKGLVVYIKVVTGLLMAFIMLSSFPSCQKEIEGLILDSATLPVDTIPSSVSSKVKTYTESATTSNGDHQTETFNLTYDAQNRLISMIASSEPGNKFVYQYNSNNTYSLDIYNQNVVTIHVDFILNSLLLVDSTTQYNNTSDTSNEKYIYNSAKQLIVKKEYEHSSSFGTTLLNTYTFEYDSNGNATKVTGNDEITTYTYYPNMANTINIGMIYFNRNPYLTKTTTSATAAGSVTGTANHTYTFDNNNRQITEKQTFDNGTIILKSYTY